MSDYPLALFPLHLVMFPGQRLPLHIFEDRYRALVQHCLETGERFGIVLQREGKLADVGCAVRIARVLERYDDGRMDVLTVGERRFRIHQLIHERRYLTAEVQPVHEPPPTGPLQGRERLITQHMALLDLLDEKLRPHLYDAHDHVSYFVAQNAGLDLPQKQHLLELPAEADRIAYLVDHLEALLPRLRRIRDHRRKIQGDGHFGDQLPELGFS